MRVPDPETTVEQQMLLLGLLRAQGNSTRRGLAEGSGFSISLVRQLTQALVARGLVVDAGIEAQQTPGRPSRRWTLAPDACIAVGLDVGGSFTRLVVLDTSGNVLRKHTTPTLQAESGAALLDYLSGIIRQEVGYMGLEIGDVAGLGIAFSGFIDAQRGASIDAPNIASAQGLPLQQHFEQALKLPVLVDDSSRTMTLAEMRYGAGRGFENFLCINVGAGIGMGIVSGGQLQRGMGLAGEIGHIPMQIYGERCRCGSQGCLETLASGSAIAAKARHMLEQRVPSVMHALIDGNLSAVTAKLVTEAAQQEDKLALDLLQDAGTWLGVGVATAINLFSPQKVVLTGGVMRRNDLLWDVVRKAASRYALPQIPRPLRIVLTHLDEHSAALGAATLILDDAFARGFRARLAE